jgi:hypothetical protein
MKNIIKKSLQSLLFVPVFALAINFAASAVQPTAVLAQVCPTGNNIANSGLADGAKCAQGKDQQADLFGDGGIFRQITNVLLFIIGAISVIMLIIGGIRYVVSGGDSGAVTAAKNTILYAVIGIIVALLAYALVNFVIGSFAAN